MLSFAFWTAPFFIKIPVFSLYGVFILRRVWKIIRYFSLLVSSSGKMIFF